MSWQKRVFWKPSKVSMLAPLSLKAGTRQLRAALPLIRTMQLPQDAPWHWVLSPNVIICSLRMWLSGLSEFTTREYCDPFMLQFSLICHLRD